MNYGSFNDFFWTIRSDYNLDFKHYEGGNKKMNYIDIIDILSEEEIEEFESSFSNLEHLYAELYSDNSPNTPPQKDNEIKRVVIIDL